MSTDVIIGARGLGKKYVIGHRSAERVPTLRDAIVRNTKSFLRAGGDMLRGKPLVGGDSREEFWALKNVDFDIRRGDVVGIIGRNGAGKSTLLKILSRITEPSEGHVEIDGRIASLLEVGTGFHAELTGRENIFLNGAVLGMTQAEIRKKFDEIVAFAEVEKFLDTPVKRYSSGMYVRLAFAVAAHLEPEILIVDEVLAVGDAEFQKKCLGKMQDVAGHGRTVLFVSHNMSAVADLCTTSIVLRNGKVAMIGSVNEAIRHHLTSKTEGPGLRDRRDRHGDGLARLSRVTLLDTAGQAIDQIRSGAGLVIKFEFEREPTLSSLSLAFNFRNRFGKPVANLSTKSDRPWVSGERCGELVCSIPRVPLMPDTYSCNVQISSPAGVCDWMGDAFTLDVVGSDFYPDNYVPDQGDFMIDHSWNVE